VDVLPGEEASAPGYTLVKDNSGKLSVEVPSEWSDIDGTAWDFREGKIGINVIASTDLGAWYWYRSPTGSYDASGVFFGASRSLLKDYPEDTDDQILDLEEYDYSGTCEYKDRYEYEDGVYEGKYDVWTNCGGTGTRLFVLAAVPEENPAHVMVIQVATRSEADLEAQKHILDTFEVTGEP
jgi:serine protease Do